MNLFFTRPLFLLCLLSLIPLVYFWRRTPTSLTPRRKRDALILRVLSVLCIIFALAGTQIVSRSKNLTVLFLLDRSLSTGGDSQLWQRTFITEALQKKGKEDQYGVLLFGAESGIELPAGTHGQSEMGQLTTVVDPQSTELGSALQFAATAFPGGTARRLVVLTDGRSTEGDAERDIQALSDAGIEVWLTPLPDPEGRDLLLSRLQTPSQVALDQPFLLRAVVESQGIGECRLLITENGVPKQNLKLKLKDGPNLFLLPQRKSQEGPVRYEARLLSSEDKRQQNNKGESLTLVGGEQTVLVLRGDPGEGSLVPLLREAGLRALAVQPHELPKDVGAWRDISALIIENVDSLSWNKRLQTVTSLLVREGGMGLMMSGSDATFGVGAYQRTPIEPLLPVNLSIRRPKDQPLSALIQCLDKSGSMGGDPIRMAREAAIAAGETLSKRDLLGVVGFDSAARWVVRFQAKGDGSALVKGVSSLRAGGGTDLYPALKSAIGKLERTEAPMKHVLVLSDGAVGAANYDKLLKRANAAQITISAVAFGSGADVRFLEDLAKKGNGRLFLSEQTTAGSTLAQVFIRDTVLATGAGIQEKPREARPTEAGQSSALLAELNFDQSPALLAHNMASSKGGTAKTLLQTAKKDPILAVGQAGLGQTAAWLSDLGGKWSEPWNNTPGLPGSELSLLETLMIRTVRSVVSQEQLPMSARGNHLKVQPSLKGDLANLELSLSTRRPITGPLKVISISKGGNSETSTLHPGGPFEATGSIRVTDPGSGLILVQDSTGNLLARTNFTVPLAPEFTKLGTDKQAMKRWSQAPGARFSPEPSEVFQPPLEPVPSRTPLERDLARGALLLLLLEIAVRRLPRPKLRRGKSSPKTQKTQEVSQRFSQLRAAKKSVQSKLGEREESDSSPTIERTPVKPRSSSNLPKGSVSPAREAHDPSQKPEAKEKPESTLARLKKARKKRHD